MELLVTDEVISVKRTSCVSEMSKLSINVINEMEENQPKVWQISSVERPINFLKKKLIVLDVNGLLADIVFPPPKHRKPDAFIAKKAIFKRPYYLEFLNFCFENFEVGVWSSRTQKNVDNVIDFLMGNMKQRLLFCWGYPYCTETCFKTLENKHKTMIFKDLRKIWENSVPNLPWEKGYYNESNTLLLDDSPYKALLNPPYTSVFPDTFKYRNQNDNSLGAEGDLRKYLEGLANADNMLKYVEQHPFGQEGISERSEAWSFYLEILNSVSASQPEQ